MGQQQQWGTQGPGGAPRYCRLGLPDVEKSGGTQGVSDGDGTEREGAAEAEGGGAGGGAEPLHKLAVLIPYR